MWKFNLWLNFEQVQDNITISALLELDDFMFIPYARVSHVKVYGELTCLTEVCVFLYYSLQNTDNIVKNDI